jgi:hypothetical protein
MGEALENPEADSDKTTDLGDDPLIFDSDPFPWSRIYL